MNDTAPLLIHLDSVTKVFYTDEVETHALDGITLDILTGEYIAIEGPSDCGKSTLLSILGWLDTPTDGSYTLNDRPVAQLQHAERARTRNREIRVHLPELQPDRSPASLSMRTWSCRCLSRDEAVRAQGARDRGAREGGDGASGQTSPEPASGGQQQRVAVARAVAGQPSILLADEPTGNLDSKNGQAVMDLLKALHAEGSTICMVTHDPRYAEHAGRSIHLFEWACRSGFARRVLGVLPTWNLSERGIPRASSYKTETRLFRAERDHGVHPSARPCSQETGCRRDSDEQRGHREQGERVAGRDPKTRLSSDSATTSAPARPAVAPIAVTPRTRRVTRSRM